MSHVFRRLSMGRLVVLSVAIPIDQQLLLLLLLLLVAETAGSPRPDDQVLFVEVDLVIANRSGPVPAPTVFPTVLQMVVVWMNQERIVTTQNKFVTKYANIFQKQQNQYQTHTNILFGAATCFELGLAVTSTLANGKLPFSITKAGKHSRFQYKYLHKVGRGTNTTQGPTADYCADANLLNTTDILENPDPFLSIFSRNRFRFSTVIRLGTHRTNRQPEPEAGQWRTD